MKRQLSGNRFFSKSLSLLLNTSLEGERPGEKLPANLFEGGDNDQNDWFMGVMVLTYSEWSINAALQGAPSQLLMFSGRHNKL